MKSKFVIVFSLLLVFINIFSSSTLWAASMVTSNILSRIFCLRVGEKQATGFTIEVDGRQYLITARHLLPSAPSKGVVEILRDAKWRKLDFRSVQVEPATVDIAVLALSEQLPSRSPVVLGFKNVALSQEVFFLGFPFGLSINERALNNGFPFPMAKHGIISSIVDTQQGEPFLVDGMNNPGFSGGPVVCMEGGIIPENNGPKIIGVVSAYRATQEPVYNRKTKTNLTAQANTSLLVAFPIDYAIEGIKKNPIGLQLLPAP